MPKNIGEKVLPKNRHRGTALEASINKVYCPREKSVAATQPKTSESDGKSVRYMLETQRIDKKEHRILRNGKHADAAGSQLRIF